MAIPENVSLLLLGMILLSSVEAAWKAEPSRKLVQGDGYKNLQTADRRLCITVHDSAQTGAGVEFQPCEIFPHAENQLWQLDDQGKIKSKVNPNQCMTLNSLMGGTRVRMEPCDGDTELNLFSLNEHYNGQIIVQADGNFCLTHQGQTQEAGDPIEAKQCEDRSSFLFVYTYSDYTGTSGLTNDDYDDYENVDCPNCSCLIVEGGDPQPGRKLLMGDCSINHVWRYDQHGLLHTDLDDTMCMQAGHNSDSLRNARGEGTKVRLYPCNEHNRQQIFDYNFVDIKLRDSDDLCVGFQGDFGHANDEIILKECGERGDNWSEDGSYLDHDF